MAVDRGWEIDGDFFKINVKSMPTKKEVQDLNEGQINFLTQMMSFVDKYE